MKSLSDMMNMKSHIIDKLKEYNYSPEKISEVEKRLTYNIDKSIKYWGHKTIRRNYLSDVDPKNITYYKLSHFVSSICISNQNGTYNVAFSFLNPKDSDLCNDWKKYPLTNYITSKYRYDNIKAVSPMRAICYAYNDNRKHFPNKHKKCKYKLTFSICGDSLCPSECFARDIDTSGVYDATFNNIIKDKKSSSGINFAMTKTFYDYFGMNIMSTKNDDGTFTITFSFINPKEYIGHTSKSRYLSMLSLIENRIDNKYTYISTKSTNSYDAICWAFNKYKNKFPSRYEHLTLSVIIAKEYEYLYHPICVCPL